MADPTLRGAAYRKVEAVARHLFRAYSPGAGRAAINNVEERHRS